MSIDGQVAGVEIDGLYLRALESNGNGTCSPLDTTNANFDLSIQCIDPANCSEGLKFKVGSQALKDDQPVSVLLSNEGPGVYKLSQAVYDNAGLIRLSASYSFDNGFEAKTLEADSENFAVRPYKFNIVATNGSKDLTQKTNAEFDYTQVAGDIFEFQVEAVNYGDNGSNGEVTLNYVPSAQLEAKVTRSIPVNGFNGDFSYDGNTNWPTTWQSVALDFSHGTASSATATYSEVGAFKVNVRDNDYYGMSFSADRGLGAEVGRFIPDRFELVPANTSVTNYVTDNDDRTNDFTYLGQYALAFDYKVKAVNVAGKITKNYPLLNNSQIVTFFAEDRFDPLLPDLLEKIDGSSPKQEDWVEGAYTHSELARLIRYENCGAKLDSPCGPYNNVGYGMNILDNDAVELSDHDMYLDAGVEQATTISKQTSRQLYGRWTIADAYGPISNDFATTMQLEYFDGTNFTPNTDDSITSFDADNAELTDVSLGGALPTLSGSGRFANGVTQGLIIAAPNRNGEVKLDYSVDDWLKYKWEDDHARFDQSPSANIVFGFFYGNDRVIYRRRLN